MCRLKPIIRLYYLVAFIANLARIDQCGAKTKSGAFNSIISSQ